MCECVCVHACVFVQAAENAVERATGRDREQRRMRRMNVPDGKHAITKCREIKRDLLYRCC